jgi:transposase
MTTATLQTWGGLDWHQDQHRLCVYHPDGSVKCQRAFKEGASGFAELVACLRECPDFGGLCVEATRQPVIYRLVQAGIRVYPVNPKMAKAWRAGLSADNAKDDARDALALATGLCVHHARLCPLVPDTARGWELAWVCQDHARLVQTRTRHVQRLQAALKLYYPQAFEWFSDWTQPGAWAFVDAFPSPAELARASRKRLYGFFKTHRLRLTPTRQALVEAACNTPVDETLAPMTNALSLRVKTVVHELRTVQADLVRYEARIHELFEDHPDKALYESLPGAGDTLEPRLATIFGESRERADAAEAVPELSGVAPVTVKSGKGKPKVRFRWACNKYLRNTAHLYAACSMRRCAWAKAYYDLSRARGDKHALALRKLAQKWLKILYRMWQDREPYDEQRYLDSLKKHGSPVWNRIEEQLPEPGG